MTPQQKPLEETVTTRLPLDVYQQLQAHGVEIDRKLGWIARKAIVEYLARLPADSEDGR